MQAYPCTEPSPKLTASAINVPHGFFVVPAFVQRDLLKSG